MATESQKQPRPSRDEFLGVIAHALKNPLSVIVTGSALLLKGTATTEQELRARRQVEAIQRSALRMNRLITDILELSSLSLGLLVPERKPSPAAQLVQDAVDVHEAQAKEKSIRLAGGVASLDEAVLVLCDRERVQRVLAELIGNAFKFTGEGGSVTVSAAVEGAAVRFRVADTGRGMSAEELEHVFDRDWLARRRDREGIGVGLALAKAIIDAQGGEIRAESREGAGSTFSFTLVRG